MKRRMRSICLAVLVAGCGGKSSTADHDDHGKPAATAPQAAGEHGDEHGERAEGVVRLTKEQIATAKIATEVVATRTVSAEIQATAEIVPPDDGVARIGSKISGRITKLPVSVGSLVKAGALVAIVDSPELGTAKAEYLATLAHARLTRETADREKQLFDKKISSEQDYRVAEAEATKARALKEAAEARLHTLGFTDAQLQRFTAEQHASSSIMVTTPIAGILVERPVSLGQVIQPEDTVGVVMDLSSVWMQVDAYERDLSQLAVGQKVSAFVSAWPEREFKGDIQSIGATIDRRSRTLKVRVVIPNPDGALKPGMFAKVSLAGSKGEAREGLFAPSAAVQRDGDKSIVFVPLSETEFRTRSVETGVASEGWIQITRGLAVGEKVVTTGAFQLKSEARRGSFGGHEH